MNETKASHSALFSFDPADIDPEDESQRFKEKNREAFRKADYAPPETVTAEKAPAKKAPAKKAAKPQSKPELPKVPSFRRKRGRPAGDRRYRVSFKSTEQHLAVLYGIAGEGELVGVFERAVELLAREVAQSGRYGGRRLDSEAKKAVDALLREAGAEH